MKPKKESVLEEFNLGSASKKNSKIISLLSDLKSFLINSKTTHESTGTPEYYTYIPTCRSIRIGSYKNIKIKDKVFFTQKAIYIRVPHLTDPEYMNTLIIPVEDILKIEIYSDQGTPLLFISTCACSCFRIRKDLNLEEYKYRGLNFDLNSTDDTMKKIVILPEMLPPETLEFLKMYYGMVELVDDKKGNELLVKSTPKVVSYLALESIRNWNLENILQELGEENNTSKDKKRKKTKTEKKKIQNKEVGATNVNAISEMKPTLEENHIEEDCREHRLKYTFFERFLHGAQQKEKSSITKNSSNDIKTVPALVESEIALQKHNYPKEIHIKSKKHQRKITHEKNKQIGNESLEGHCGNSKQKSQTQEKENSQQNFTPLQQLVKKYENLPSEVVEYLENVEQEHHKQKETIEKMVPNLEKFEELMLEKQKLEEDRLCKICMEAEICCVFIPCGHLITCEDCAKTLSVRTFKHVVSGELKKCPLCRKDIIEHIRTYLP